MQFAENFHQSKPEPVQFARAARLIMAEDPSLTAAEVSRIVGAPPAWTRKALRLLELPEAIVERVERGDLSFTAADFVRRGIARGDVSAEKAEELVEEHANGALSGVELKYGVGYVPPPPENYDEVADRLDAARREAARGRARSATTTTPRSPRPSRSRRAAVHDGRAAHQRRRRRRLHPRRLPLSLRHGAFAQGPADHRRGGRARVRALAAAERAPQRAALAGEGSDRSGLIGR